MSEPIEPCPNPECGNPCAAAEVSIDRDEWAVFCTGTSPPRRRGYLDACGYRGPEGADPDEAIALHNRIARAVREATEWRQRAEAAEAEIERLRHELSQANQAAWEEGLEAEETRYDMIELQQRAEAAEAERDAAIRMLAEWCVDVDTNGTSWDDWDENYKDAMYRPGPLRALLDRAIESARAWRTQEPARPADGGAE